MFEGSLEELRQLADPGVGSLKSKRYWSMNAETSRTKEAAASERPSGLRGPRVTVLDQKQVLEVFQITSAGVSWWG
jgi:hypothetical protein